MINAKEEFLNITEKLNVIAADITFNDSLPFKLKPLYTKKDWKDLLKYLDRNYENRYGSQNLYGIVYCENGNWIDRGIYDGSEWWRINRFPDMRMSFEETDMLKYERYMKLKNLKQ